MPNVAVGYTYPDVTYRYRYLNFSQDTVVNSIGSKPLNKSYRDVNAPVHVPIRVHPAVIINLSPDALALLSKPSPI